MHCCVPGDLGGPWIDTDDLGWVRSGEPVEELSPYTNEATVDLDDVEAQPADED